MVDLATGSSDLILILGCMTSNLLDLSFSVLYSSSLWRADTIVFPKLNKSPLPLSTPPSLLNPPSPSNRLEMNKSPGGLNNRLGSTLNMGNRWIEKELRHIVNFETWKVLVDEPGWQKEVAVCVFL